jgi:hypothetical protein
MRNLLALLGFALVTFLAVGWYLDWYHITPKATATPGHQGVELDLNRKKIGEDVTHGIKVGEEKLHELIDKNGKPVPAAGSPR